MGYRLVTIDQLGQIWTRLKRDESQRAIARALGFDRKTVKVYVEEIQKLALAVETGYDEALAALDALLVKNARDRPAMAVLSDLEDEIRVLLVGNREQNKEPMKAKTAWIVIRDRYSLSGKASYESFKRLVRERHLVSGQPKATVRIEVEPGAETQIDYAKMGVWAVGGKNRLVYSFIGVLSCSRFPFVLFVTTQDQVSFAKSIVVMVSWFGGATERLNLDNLKSGVLRADIYDPALNRTFAELCDHYGIIADPARVASPKDKGKVERIVQVVRELWKRLTALHPQATLDELNAFAATWSRDEYGQHIHGTTGIAPWIAFSEIEREKLLPLPLEPFVPAAWSIASVHPDQFIQVKNKYYGLPATLIGKTVMVRSTDSLVQLYFNHKLVRSYPVTGKRLAFLPDDFPDIGQPFVPNAYMAGLIVRAQAFGPQASSYIRLVLENGGNLAARRALGCLSLLDHYQDMPGFSHVIGHAIAHRVFLPPRLKALFESESLQKTIPFPISPRGMAMGRNADYYTRS